MARIPKKPRYLKDGTAVYDVVDYLKESQKKLNSKTYIREKGITENEHKRRINAFAVNFETELRNQLVAKRQELLQKNELITFKEFSLRWLKRSELKDSKSSLKRNEKVVEDLNNFLGTLPLKQIRADNIDRIVLYLNSKKIVNETAKLKMPIDKIIEKTNVDKLCRENDFSTASVFYAKKGNNIIWEYAVKL